jgi:hypothetical protein
VTRINSDKTAIALRLAAGAAMALALSSAAHAAVEIDIGTSLNGGPVVLQASSAPSVGGTVETAPNLVIGDFLLQSVAATFGPLPSLLDSNTIDARAVGGGATDALDIFVTIRNLQPAALTHGELFSAFSASLAPRGLTMATFFDASNAMFGTATPLRSVAANGAPLAAGFANFVAPPSGAFSLTERFHLARPESVNATMDLASAAPEPGAWALMIMGFGAVGALLRRARRMAFAA